MDSKNADSSGDAQSDSAGRVCRCGKTITEYHWRCPERCVECYLNLKRGAVIVCTEGDVRMLDNVPGGYAMRMARAHDAGIIRVKLRVKP
jgi:hypothetical protein